MSKLRVALLGCGRVSQRYLEVFDQELRDIAELRYVCDLDAHKMQKFVDCFDAKACNSIGALIDEKPDLVCILTESGNHFEHARMLIVSGCNVVVEKPVAMRPDQVQELADLALRHNVSAAVVKQNRFNPAIQFARNAIDSGRIGDIRFCSIRVHWSRTQSYYDDGWHGTWKMDGGVLNQQAIHHVDALNWLAGPVESVCARGERLLNRLEAEDSAVGIVRLSNGGLGTVEATTAATDRDFEASLTIVGSGGYLKVGGIALNEIQVWDPASPQSGDADVLRKYSQEVPSGYGLGHGPLLRKIICAIQSGKDVPIDIIEGGKAVSLVHAFYRSMEIGGWVDLSCKPVSEYLGK